MEFEEFDEEYKELGVYYDDPSTNDLIDDDVDTVYSPDEETIQYLVEVLGFSPDDVYDYVMSVNGG